MALRQFNIQLDDGFEDCITALVVINETPEAMQKMREMVYFWSGAERMVAKHKGDITKAFINYFANAIEGYKQEIYSIDELHHRFANEEGFYPLDEKWLVVREFTNTYQEPGLSLTIKEMPV